MIRSLGASAAVLLTLSSAHAQVHNIADLPFPPDFHPSVRPPAQAEPTVPYTRQWAKYYCRLALDHPPFPRVPFAETEFAWLGKCIQRFTDPNVATDKRAETLVCEQRASDVMAEAARHGLGVESLRPYKSFLAQCERQYRANAFPLSPPESEGKRAELPRKDPPPAPRPPSVTPAPEPKTRPYNPREREAVLPVQPAPAPPARPKPPEPAAPPPLAVADDQPAPAGSPSPAIAVAAVLILASVGGLVALIGRWDHLESAASKLASPKSPLRKLREKEAKLYAAAAARAFKAAEEEPQEAEQHLKKASEFTERARKAQSEINIVDELATVEEAEARERLNEMRHKQDLARERRDIERAEVTAGKSKAASSVLQAAFEAKVAEKLHADEFGPKQPEAERSTAADLRAIIEKIKTDLMADGNINGAHELAGILQRFKKEGPHERA